MENGASRRGFTIVEILVALVLIAILAAVLIPNVIGQANRGEINQVIEDADAIGDAATMFRMDVKRWPADLTDLNTQPATNDLDLDGNQFGNLANRWSGPYLERGAITGALDTGLGASVQNALTSTTWGSADFVTLEIRPVDQDDATTIRQMIDGDEAVTSTDGRVYWTSANNGTLWYRTRQKN